MTRADFADLFRHSLEEAAVSADTKLGRPVPRTFGVELHGVGSRSGGLSFDDALQALYLGPDRFYRIIDIAIRAVTDHELIAFVRISGHQPVGFNDTWNPEHAGPFKQLQPGEIVDHRAPERTGFAAA